MKTIIVKLVLASISVFGFSCCIAMSGMPEQVTSLNVDCKTKDIEIFNDTVALNGEESWTAKCDGKTYECTYLPESGSECFEVVDKLELNRGDVE